MLIRALVVVLAFGEVERRARAFRACGLRDRTGWIALGKTNNKVSVRLRPLEIKVPVNYARLSINIVRLANALKLRRPGAWDRCTAGFQSRLCPVRVTSGHSAMSAQFPLYPPKADIRRAALAERLLSAAAVDFIVLQRVPVAGTARVGG
jgi:hypothetical protein